MPMNALPPDYAVFRMLNMCGAQFDTTTQGAQNPDGFGVQ
jgi:hypothetical protein